MPQWNRWISWISSYRYTFEAYVRNNFTDWEFKIDVIGQLNLDFGKWNSIFLNIALFGGFSLAAYLILKYKK